MNRTRKARWGKVFAAAVCMGMLLPQTAARAGDGGLQEFFAQQFGFFQQSAPAAPTWSDDEADRPLIVRPRHRRKAVAQVASPKGPTPKISIYEDPTLRRGDAVMTANGIRIFRGGSLPYRAEDFVAVSAAPGLSNSVEKQLVAINQLPRS